MENLSERLVEKSIESFITGLELYNKPTLKYRVEGFSFFICNAWELMLKAKLINDGQNIYFDNSNRTISLSKAIRTVYTDSNQPLRMNLEKIIDLRNTSTHFVTEDYETIFAPLFQSNIISFGEQLERFHQKDITKYIPQNFLTLSATMEPLTNEQIKIKYPPEIAQDLIFKKNDIQVTSELTNNDHFSIDVSHNLYQVKKRGDSDFTFRIARDGEIPVQSITKYKDPSETHIYAHHNLAKEINNRLKKQKINIGEGKNFTASALTEFIKFYNMKNDKKYSFKHEVGKNITYSYSQAAADFIINELKKDPENKIQNLKKANKKKITPGT
ncbi:DUF3644 domain-containing protein [Leuconostocaceae bacterium ESL0958]|nr:DUF3644 domain-containing protein [Leuconostocaceae bacterium ESL0958]